MDGRYSSTDLYHAQGSSGWEKLEDAVRQVDERKVKDYTDDLDALLVFAGLYSAVLTAFLVQSWPNLTSDNQAVTRLLRQISTQTAGYRQSSGYINATVTIPAEGFRAAVTDIRVNVCWFTSLIFALSTASFSILVKQWLREYLSIEQTVSKERVRIRQYRLQGLKIWRLFGIAALLPLLLQTALGLFFVGLCFFTTSVDRSIGVTSTVLVSAWAFFVFSALFMSLFSPRCPYKTPMSKNFFPAVRDTLRLARRSIMPRRAAHSPPSRTNMQPTVDFFRHLVFDDSGDTKTDDSSLRHAFELPSWSQGAKVTTTNPKFVYFGEEKDICKSHENDFAIYDAIDAAMMDNRVLDHISEIIRHHSRPPEEAACEFVIGAVSRRIGSFMVSSDPLTEKRMLDLRGLSRSSWRPLIEILGHVLSHGPVRGDPIWFKFAFAVVFLSLSPTFHPDSLLNVIRRLLEERGPTIPDLIPEPGTYERPDGWDVTAAFMSNVAAALKIMAPSKAWTIVNDVIAKQYVSYRKTRRADEHIRLLLRGAKRGNSASLKTVYLLIDPVVSMLTTGLSGGGTRVAPPTVGIWSPWMHASLSFLIRVVRAFPDDLNIRYGEPAEKEKIQALMTRLFVPTIISHFLERLACMPEVLCTSAWKNIFNFSHIESEGSEALEILRSCEDYFMYRIVSGRTLPALTALRLCFMICTFQTSEDMDDTAQGWRRVLSSIALNAPHWSMKTTRQLTESDKENAYTLLRAVDRREKLAYWQRKTLEERLVLEGVRQATPGDTQALLDPYSRWLRRFDILKHYYPDDMLQIILNAVDIGSHPDVLSFWRIRRLQESASELRDPVPPGMAGADSQDGGTINSAAGSSTIMEQRRTRRRKPFGMPNDWDTDPNFALPLSVWEDPTPPVIARDSSHTTTRTINVPDTLSRS